MDFPGFGKERGHIVFREEVRRAVRPVQHTELPFSGDRGPALRGNRARFVRRFAASHMQNVARAQCPAAVATELAEGEGRATSHILGYVEAAANREIGAAADGRNIADAKNLTRPHLDGRPEGHGLVAYGRRHGGATQANERVGVEFERGSRDGHFQCRGVRLIADRPIHETKRNVIHRPRWRNADVPITRSSGIVLDGGLRASRQDFHAVRSECERLQSASRHASIGEHRIRNQAAQIVQVGLYPGDRRFGQRLLQFAQRFIPVAADRDDFRQQRIVQRRHLGAIGDPRFDARIGGEARLRHQARRRPELPRRIFGIHAHLDRCSKCRRRPQREALAGRLTQHPFNQIDAEDFFGYAVFHL